MPSGLISADEKLAILAQLQGSLQACIAGARANIAKDHSVGALACIQAGIVNYTKASVEHRLIFDDSSLAGKVAELAASVSELFQLKDELKVAQERAQVEARRLFGELLERQRQGDDSEVATSPSCAANSSPVEEPLRVESSYNASYAQLKALLGQSPENKEADKLIQALLLQVDSLKETESEDTLTWILRSTFSYLTNPKRSADAYRDYADEVQGSPSLGLKIAGGLMIALGFTMLLGCAIYLTPVALAVGAVGAVSLFSGVGFFDKGSRRTGVSAAMCEIDDKVSRGNVVYSAPTGA